MSKGVACSLSSHQPRSDADSMACRRDYRARLHPVRGGDLRDRIRSELMGSESLIKQSIPNDRLAVLDLLLVVFFVFEVC